MCSWGLKCGFYCWNLCERDELKRNVFSTSRFKQKPWRGFSVEQMSDFQLWLSWNKKKEKLTKQKQNKTGFHSVRERNENMAMFSEQPSSSRLRKLKAQSIRLSFGFYIWSLLGNCRNKKGNCQKNCKIVFFIKAFARRIKISLDFQKQGDHIHSRSCRPKGILF